LDSGSVAAESGTVIDSANAGLAQVNAAKRTHDILADGFIGLAIL
jgi:hypothetical protein